MPCPSASPFVLVILSGFWVPVLAACARLLWLAGPGRLVSLGTSPFAGADLQASCQEARF